jgi:hypothetical protein
MVHNLLRRPRAALPRESPPQTSRRVARLPHPTRARRALMTVCNASTAPTPGPAATRLRPAHRRDGRSLPTRFAARTAGVPRRPTLRRAQRRSPAPPRARLARLMAWSVDTPTATAFAGYPAARWGRRRCARVARFGPARHSRLHARSHALATVFHAQRPARSATISRPGNAERSSSARAARGGRAWSRVLNDPFRGAPISSARSPP